MRSQLNQPLLLWNFPDQCITADYKNGFRAILEQPKIKVFQLIAQQVDWSIIAFVLERTSLDYVQIAECNGNSIVRQLIYNRLKCALMVSDAEWLVKVNDHAFEDALTRGDFQVSTVEHITLISENWPKLANFDLAIAIGDDVTDVQQLAAIVREFLDEFGGACSAKLLHDSFVIQLPQGIENEWIWITITVKSSAGIAALKAMPATIRNGIFLKLIVIVSFGATGQDTNIDFSPLHDKGITIIRFMDENVIVQFLWELGKNVERWRVQAISGPIGPDLAASDNPLRGVLQSIFVEYVLLHGDDEPPFELLDGIIRLMDPAPCFHALQQTPSGNAKQVVCLRIPENVADYDGVYRKPCSLYVYMLACHCAFERISSALFVPSAGYTFLGTLARAV